MCSLFQTVVQMIGHKKTLHTTADVTYEALLFIWNFLGLWAVVNNAGIVGCSGPIDWMAPEDFMETLHVNAIGSHSVTKAFLPLLRGQGGRVVITSSIVGRCVIPLSAPYMVSKYAAEGMAECLR